MTLFLAHFGGFYHSVALFYPVVGFLELVTLIDIAAGAG
jgi:hypothetical protein